METRKVFKMWHRGRDVDGYYNDEMWDHVPDRIPRIGEVMEICYWSSKFARECLACGEVTELKVCPKCHGRTVDAPHIFELYTHTCDSNAPIYAVVGRPDSDEYLEPEITGSGRVDVTFLAFMAEMTFKTNAGKKLVQGFSFSSPEPGGRNTPLYCMGDLRTLFIPWSKRPMIVTGAKMRVTKHGLVR